MEEARGVATLSKKGYHELERRLKERELGEETVRAVMETVREVLRFDPGVNRYTTRVLEQTRAWRARQKAEMEGMVEKTI